MSRHCHISLGIRSYCLRILSLQLHHLSCCRGQSGKSCQLSPILLIILLCVPRKRTKNWEEGRMLGAKAWGCSGSLLLVQCSAVTIMQYAIFLDLPCKLVHGSVVLPEYQKAASFYQLDWSLAYVWMLRTGRSLGCFWNQKQQTSGVQRHEKPGLPFLVWVWCAQPVRNKTDAKA